MLHIIKNETGFKHAQCYLNLQDAIILIQDASYLAGMPLFSEKDNVFVLSEDLQARGLSVESSNNLQVIDFKGFVELTEIHENSITWE
ncbi:sulfurtransferase complex subunit TusB [Vibrio sp. E150_011]